MGHSHCWEGYPSPVEVGPVPLKRVVPLRVAAGVHPLGLYLPLPPLPRCRMAAKVGVEPRMTTNRRGLALVVSAEEQRDP
jgi:hypothetical protein